MPNKKNGGNVPIAKDNRVLWVPTGCGKCMECRKQKARAISIRLQEEIRTDTTGQFVTLTFSNESIIEIKKDIKGLEGYELDNEIATVAVRRFLERWRKKFGVSVKHWLITELGHNGTENIHLHGIIFSKNKEEIKSIWKYGFVYIGEYVNNKTINYTVKYATKTDPLHKEYNPKILTSPGIGKKYLERTDSQLNKFNNKKTDERYTTRQGQRVNLPIYYRNKIYSEDEREQLWLQKLDKNERWICGTKIDTSKGMDNYYKTLAHYQKKNKQLGYGDDSINWERINYENERRKLMQSKRTEKKYEETIDLPEKDSIFVSINKQNYENERTNPIYRNKRDDRST